MQICNNSCSVDGSRDQTVLAAGKWSSSMLDQYCHLFIHNVIRVIEAVSNRMFNIIVRKKYPEYG